MKPLYNYVILKQLPPDETITFGDLTIIVPEVWKNESNNIQRWCEVIEVPAGLRMFTPHTGASMEFVTKMELKIGDRVLCDYLALSNATGTAAYPLKSMYQENIILKYSDIYLAIRDYKIVMLNGYCLIECIEDTITHNKIIIPEYLQKKKNTKKGIVRKIGCLNTKYLASEFVDTDEVREGMTVYFRKHSNVPIEDELHQTLGKEYYAIQRNRLEAYIEV